MAIPRSTIDYGSMTNEEYDERIAQEHKRIDRRFFRALLFTRGNPITAAPQRQEKRTEQGTCGDYITS